MEERGEMKQNQQNPPYGHYQEVINFSQLSLLLTFTKVFFFQDGF